MVAPAAASGSRSIPPLGFYLSVQRLPRCSSAYLEVPFPDRSVHLPGESHERKLHEVNKAPPFVFDWRAKEESEVIRAPAR